MLKKTAALMLAASLLAGVSAYAESTAYSSFSSYSYSSVTNSDGKTVTRSSSGSLKGFPFGTCVISLRFI